MNEITSMIPQYGELNRIYKELINNHSFSFDKQKFITEFFRQHNDITAFETAILKFVLNTPKEQYTLVLKSLKKEIEENILIYETHPLLNDSIITRVCNSFADRYKLSIEAQLDIIRKLSKPLNEAYNRYDSIGYREHTAEEEKRAEKEYELRKAEYDKEKAQLDKLYELQKQAQKEAFQYMENYCDDIYRQSMYFINILKKYVHDTKSEQGEPNKNEQLFEQQVAAGELHEYFGMKRLLLIHEVCVGEQFEDISEMDFYANINLQPNGSKLKIRPREKARVCYLIFLMGETLPKQERENWKRAFMELLGIEENYYKSKYKEPASDFPSDTNQEFAKKMRTVFR